MSESSRKRVGKGRRVWLLASVAFLILVIAAFAARYYYNERSFHSDALADWHVFLAATNHYPERIVPLKYAEADVDELAKVFKSLGVKDENITILKPSNFEFPDRMPTKESLLRSYEKFIAGLTERSVAFVFLAGHGFSERKKDGEELSYYVPYDCYWDKLDDKKISIDMMMENLSTSRARFKWLCVDACRDTIERGIGDNESLSISNVPEGVIVTQSCQSGQKSYEAGRPKAPFNNGLFTRALIDSIRGRSPRADVDRDGVVTLGELRDYVTDRVPRDAQRYCSGVQNPSFSAKDARSFEQFAQYPLVGDERIAEVPEQVAQAFYRQGFVVFRQAEATHEKEKYREALGYVDKALGISQDNQYFKDLKELIEGKIQDSSRILPPPPANPLPGDVWMIPIAGIDVRFHWCPSGKFTIGSPESEEDRDNDEPQFDVTLENGFWIAETETTQALWRAAMGNNPSQYQGDDLPVEKVSWLDCNAFIEAIQRHAPDGMTFGLPTEAQWEYACRAGTTTAYSWGDQWNEQNGNNNSRDGTKPVGSYSYVNPWGLRDMHGNVWEWCEDDMGENPSRGGLRAEPDLRVGRGGAWYGYPGDCRSASRYRVSRDYVSSDLGFRIAMTGRYNFISNSIHSDELADWHVFLAGANYYPEGMPSLHFVEDDIDELEKVFKSLGVKEENITILKSSNPEVDKRPTKFGLTKSYETFLEGVTERSVAFVYLSGFGFSKIENERASSYYVPCDCFMDELGVKSLSIDEMTEQLARSQARFKWMCLDTGRNLVKFDGNVPKSYHSDEEVPNFQDELYPGWDVHTELLVSYACQAFGVSYECSKVGGGFFARALIDAISGRLPKADFNCDGVITVAEVQNYVTDSVLRDSKRFMRSEQLPSFLASDKDVFEDTLFVKQSTPAEQAQALFERAYVLSEQVSVVKLQEALEFIKTALAKEPEHQSYKLLEERIENKIANVIAMRTLPENPQPGDVWSVLIAGIDVRFCWCPPGEFIMGSSADEEELNDDETQHTVEITSGFWMAQTETTRELWKEIMKNDPGSNYEENDSQPVDEVSWEDCQDFIKTIQTYAPSGMRFQLPSEAHWEYACRAGSTTAYSWGDQFDSERKKLLGGSSCYANAWNLQNMHGLVREWCQDWYGKDYPTNKVKDPLGPASGSRRVVRGGSWKFSSFPRSALRDSYLPSERRHSLGFRLELVYSSDDCDDATPDESSD